MICFISATKCSPTANRNCPAVNILPFVTILIISAAKDSIRWFFFRIRDGKLFWLVRFGGQIFFSGFIVYCSFMSSLIKKTTSSMVVFLLTEWWWCFWRLCCLLPPQKYILSHWRTMFALGNSPLFFSSTCYCVGCLQHSDHEVHAELTLIILLHPSHTFWYNLLQHQSCLSRTLVWELPT